jgi:beta-phosphoglucomutase
MDATYTIREKKDLLQPQSCTCFYMLEIIRRSDMILLDFDGLLVDTEFLHYQAYLQAVNDLGGSLALSFEEYIDISLKGAQAIKKVIDEQCPDLEKRGIPWEQVYSCKKETLLQIVREKPVSLMPGVPELLKWISANKKKASVVTNSPRVLIELVKEKQPLLDQIPHWITREDYKEQKPHPECYQLAKTRYCQASDRVVGFEDSPKGMRALLAAKVPAIMVCPYSQIQSEEFEERGEKRFYSLLEIFSSG